MNSPGFSPRRSIGERCLYLLWVGYAIVSFVSAALCGEILLMTLLYTLISNTVIQSPSFALVFLKLSVFACINAPVSLKLRQFGITRFHFLEHENSLNVNAWSPKDDQIDILPKMEQLLKGIDDATIEERQAARILAKAWLVANRERMNSQEIAHAEEHFGYLLPPDWKGKFEDSECETDSVPYVG